VMVPVDHVLLREARLLPAIVVVRLPNGITHFLVAWRRHGPFVQRWRNGKKRTEGTFCHGLQCGRWITWNEDGQELGAIQYEEIRGKP